ncbi:MAG: hypothetical protein ACHREM_01975 [Polyangiales bacterium]
MAEPDPKALARDVPVTALAEAPDEPPIVARMVIEIRSDGTRTIARGAMEDVTLGQKVAIEAEGTTPLALAMQLAKSIGGLPALATASFGQQLKDRVEARVRGLLGARRRDPK